MENGLYHTRNEKIKKKTRKKIDKAKTLPPPKKQQQRQQENNNNNKITIAVLLPNRHSIWLNWYSLVENQIDRSTSENIFCLPKKNRAGTKRLILNT